MSHKLYDMEDDFDSATTSQEKEARIISFTLSYKFQLNTPTFTREMKQWLTHSPEEPQDLPLPPQLLEENLLFFYDVTFQVDNKLIKANTQVLRARSAYFRAMFSSRHKFKEHGYLHTVKVQGIPPVFFQCIMTYLNTDTLSLDGNVESYLKLLVFSDYFLLARLSSMVSRQLQGMVSQTNVLGVLLIAHAHNATELEQHCVGFICKFIPNLSLHPHWLELIAHGSLPLINHISASIDTYREQNFIPLALLDFECS